MAWEFRLVGRRHVDNGVGLLLDARRIFAEDFRIGMETPSREAALLTVVFTIPVKSLHAFTPGLAGPGPGESAQDQRSRDPRTIDSDGARKERIMTGAMRANPVGEFK